MPEIEITDLNGVGLIRDQEGNYLPPEALTHAMNMRAVADGIERIGGQAQVFGTPNVPPHFALPIQSTDQTYWLYVDLESAHVYSAGSHTNITRGSGAYNAGTTRNWNGTLLGGVPILNNGVDVPQWWPALSPATQLADLPNWDGDIRAKVIRAFGPHLFALNIVDDGDPFPHHVRWSHPADPGSVPISWDVADETKDAGEVMLPDVNAGVIVDGLPLRGNFYIYKEASTWRVTFVGGAFIFKFDTAFETSGALAPRCMTITADGQRHVVASQDDIIVHNGTVMDSVLDRRYKRYLANNLDSDNYKNSFMFTNPFRDEAVFCYPEPGFIQPNRALIWNYKRGEKGVLTEADVNFRNATIGQIESASPEAWDDGSDTWDDPTGPWSLLSRRRVVVCGTDDTKFFSYDDEATQTNDGNPFTGRIQRENIALVGRKRNGEWIVDFEKRKMFRRLWIRATGGPFNVRVGFTEQMNGATTWTTTQTFNPATQHWIDVFGSGRAIGVEFNADVPFRILSYKFDGELIGDGM